MKLKAKDLKALKKVNPSVGEIVDNFIQKRSSKNIYLYVREEGWKVYFAEGSSYTFCGPTHLTGSVKMASDSTVGAAAELNGLNYQVNKHSPPVPEGIWVLEEDLFMGNWVLNINYVGSSALLEGLCGK